MSHICGFREKLEQDKVSSITAKIQARQTQTQNRGMYGQNQRRPLRTRKVKLSGPGVKWAAGASQGGGLDSQKDTPLAALMKAGMLNSGNIVDANCAWSLNLKPLLTY